MQQGTDLITQLAQIRQQQGLEPLPNPGFIQGFGENDPPSPPPPVYPPSFPGDEEDEPTPSPAQEFYVKKTQPPIHEDEMVVPQFKLVVMDNLAQYAGHATVITQQEQDQIAEIIVKAVKRELDAAISPGTSVYDRYRESMQERTTAEPAKRKRGRPRKNAPAS